MFIQGLFRKKIKFCSLLMHTVQFIHICDIVRGWWSRILAGSLAGLSILALDDSSRRRTLALYLLARLAQVHKYAGFLQLLKGIVLGCQGVGRGLKNRGKVYINCLQDHIANCVPNFQFPVTSFYLFFYVLFWVVIDEPFFLSVHITPQSQRTNFTSGGAIGVMEILYSLH